MSKQLAPVIPGSAADIRRMKRAGTARLKSERPIRQVEPRRWLYVTKPRFVRLTHSLEEAFNEAEEARLILDLADFRTGDVCLEIKPDRYFIAASHEDMNFVEEIHLPDEVDVWTREEHFKDGVLELVLVKKAREGGPARTGKGDDG